MDKTLVSAVMTPAPITTTQDATLLAASKLMLQHECGSLPVTTAGNHKPVGILTDRDIVIYGIAADMDASKTPVSAVMSPDVITCNEHDTLSLAADVMGEHDVHRLVVLDKNGDITGIISASDMIKCADSDSVNDDVLHHLYRYA